MSETRYEAGTAPAHTQRRQSPEQTGFYMSQVNEAVRAFQQNPTDGRLDAVVDTLKDYQQKSRDGWFKLPMFVG